MSVTEHGWHCWSSVAIARTFNFEHSVGHNFVISLSLKNLPIDSVDNIP